MTPANDLQQRYNDLIAEQGAKRAREAAELLGVSEAELVAAGCGGTATRLVAEWGRLLEGIGTLGHVMALTRNDHCVHERKGTYTGIATGNHHMLVVGPDIDLRLFPSHWAYAFAVHAESTRGPLWSLQVFDHAGTAVHKVYLQPESDKAAYDTLVAALTDPAPTALAVRPRTPRPTPRPDAEIDVAGLAKAWSELKDTHDFFPMLRTYGVDREQALRLVGAPWAFPVATSSVERMLRTASEENVDIMCFVGNDGAIQIHTGPVQRIVEMGPWINVMDPSFNLHLRQDALTSAWLVVKPTDDGPIHSLEAFSADGGMVVQFFGKRKPGIPESEAWLSVWNRLAEVTDHA